MVDLKIQEEVEEWLSGKADEFSISLAMRSAFRALPLVRLAFSSLPIESPSDWAPRVFRDVFRALAYSRAVLIYPENVFRFSDMKNAAQSAEDAGKPIARDARTIVFAIAYASFAAARNNVPHTASIAISSVFNFDPALKTEDFEAAVLEDIRSVTSNEQRGLQGYYQLDSIWYDKQPPFIDDLWQEVRSWMEKRNEDWDVWTRWYDAVLAGNITPGGVELDIFRVTLNSEEDWAKSPAHVNALIKAKEEEILGKPMSDGEMWAATQPPMSPGSIPFFRPSNTWRSGFDYLGSPPVLFEASPKNELPDPQSGETNTPSDVDIFKEPLLEVLQQEFRL